MSAKDFDVGALVWAKMKGFPAWPGKIIDPPADAKSPKQKKPQHYVYFFGSNNHAWIFDENIVPHDDSVVQSANKVRSAAYQSAIDAIVDESRNSETKKTIEPTILKEKERNPGKESSQNKTPRQNKEPSQESSQDQSKMPTSVNNVPKKRFRQLKKCVIIKKADVPVQRKTAKKLSFIDPETANKQPLNGTKTSKKRPLIKAETTKKIRRRFVPDGHESSVSQPETKPVENESADILASAPNMSLSHINAILTHDSGYHHSSRILSRPGYVERPPTPVLDVSNISESLKRKKITPCSKKIGFLGLGNMGQGIVKNLLNSGHHVTVWNRTPEKINAFLNAGATRAQTPADVVQVSDITFCCVSDPDAVKSLVFGNCGILKGLDSFPDSNKGYVEMTSIDPETSKAVGEEITLKGGRYLEAPIAGSKQNAIEGTLFILAAGDRTLFTECETCFHAMGNAHYISSDVGTGAKLNLIHSMLHGTIYAAMAESMALVQACELSQRDFLEIFKLGPLNCQPMLDKGHAILENNYLTNTPLKHIQKDISLSLTLGSSADQPLQVAAAANEVYKHAKQLRYADHDVSAVYQGIIR